MPMAKTSARGPGLTSHQSTGPNIRSDQMKLSEIIALSKAGFKAAEIRAMMQDPEPEEPEEEPEELEEPEEPEEAPEEPEEEPEEPEKEPDYKALYEESQKQLKKAQQLNRKKPINSDDKSDEEIVSDLINNYY